MLRRLSPVLTLAFVVLWLAPTGAEVRSDQKTRVEFGGALGRIANIFGGRAARDGVESTVAVSGNRKALLTGNTGQIIDLDEEKVYDLDLRRKRYRVRTFDEIRRQLEDARKKAEEDARKAEGSERPAPPDENAREMEIDIDLRATGEKKTIHDRPTEQQILTVTVREKGKTLEEGGGLVLTSDMWITPTVQAMKEIADFDRRYAAAIAGPLVAGASAEQLGAALAMYPMLKDAVARMNTEGAKVEGTPIMTTVTMDSVRSAEQMRQAAAQTEAEDAPSASGGVGGLFGGLARRAIRRKAAGDGEPQARSTFMTAVTEVLNISPDAGDATKLPEGFKEDR